MTRVLLTGADGQFGTDFQARHGNEFDIIPLDLCQCDILRLDSLRAFVGRAAPAAVVHAAAWTDVDRAEAEPDAAFAVNALGSRNVALAAEEAGARLIAISTDYVFSGRRAGAYHEFDDPDPINVYGRSKLAGERLAAAACRRCTIVRTAWLYGNTGINFPAKILRLARERTPGGPPLRVVDDQRGNPTSTAALADLVRLLIRDPIDGVVHGSCEGVASWFDLARRILESSGLDCPLEPCTTAEYPRPAARPVNSALDKMRLRLEGRPAMPHWQDALAAWLKDNRHASL